MCLQQENYQYVALSARALPGLGLENVDRLFDRLIPCCGKFEIYFSVLICGFGNDAASMTGKRHVARLAEYLDESRMP